MPLIGVNIAVFQDERLLLTRREDFEVWRLPGGNVEPGESIAQAAVRETKEETGLEVELIRLVGVYSRPALENFTSHVFLFAARPVGGSLRTQPGETIDLRYFEPGALPADLLQGQARRIEHARGGAGGSLAWRHDQIWPFEAGLTRQGLYQLRDQSGLSPADFYERFLGQSGPEGDLCEVPAAGQLERYFQSPVQLEPGAAPPELAANVAVIQEGKILLTLREDFRVWCIPGGMVEEGESIALAARRELLEETGLEVGVDRFVGVYSEAARFYHGLHVVLLAGGPVSGDLRPQVEEVLDLRFFGPDELPEHFLYGHRQRALDALNGLGGGVVWTQNMPWPFDSSLNRQDIYALRDRSGLSRAEFYSQRFPAPRPGEEVDELSGPVARFGSPPLR